MSYSPGPPDDEPTPRFLRSFERQGLRFITFYAKRPVAAWVRLWIVSVVLMFFTFLSKGASAFEGRSAGVAVMGLFGWIVPLVLLMKQKWAPDDT